MTNLQTDKIYVMNLFDKTRFFRIPHYQRPYMWSDEQVLDLLNDIHNAETNDQKSDYFLGCMIWNSTKEQSTEDYEYECQDILDGQQRFITLLLLHAVIRDISQSSKIADACQKRIWQEENDLENIPERLRVIFETRQDEVFIEDFIVKENGTSRRQELQEISKTHDSKSTRHMAEAVLTMCRWWSDKTSNLDDQEKDRFVTKFFRYLSTKVLVLYLATPNNLDDAYNLFTVLNSRGLKLRPSDILKAQNLRAINDHKTKENFAIFWEKCYSNLQPPISSFDELLRNMAVANIGFQSGETKNPNVAFRYLIRTQPQIMSGYGKPFFSFVRRYWGHYEVITDYPSKKPADVLGSIIDNIMFIHEQCIGGRAVAPIMQFIEKFGTGDLANFLIKIDNITSMDWILSRHSERRTNEIIRTINTFAERGLGLSAMYESDGFQYNYRQNNSTIEEFINHIRTSDWGSYSTGKTKKTRYMLLKLDLIYGGKNFSLRQSKPNATIEHIMPKSSKNYKHIPESEYEHWVHKIGNLVILDKSTNSALSDRSFNEKKLMYQSAYECHPYSNRLFQESESWGPSQIAQKMDEIIERVTHYYQTNSSQFFTQ